MDLPTEPPTESARAASACDAGIEGARRGADSSRSPRGPRGSFPESMASAWEEEANAEVRDQGSVWVGRDDEHGSWGSEPGPPRYIDTHDLVLAPSECGGDHRFTLLLLHSCTGGPDDFLAFFHRLDMPFRSKVRAVVPCSPVRLENHYGWEKELNSWFEYDATSGDGNAVKYPEQLVEQRERLLLLLEKERRRLPEHDSRRLVLWGLSQGAGLAVDVALRAPFPVGGVVALRGMALDAPPERPEGSAPVEVLAINGTRDWLCPPGPARESYEALRSSGACVTFEEEASLGHACARGNQRLNRNEMQRVNTFLRHVWTGLL